VGVGVRIRKEATRNIITSAVIVDVTHLQLIGLRSNQIKLLEIQTPTSFPVFPGVRHCPEPVDPVHIVITNFFKVHMKISQYPF
jgi:hypothetical protein